MSQSAVKMTNFKALQPYFEGAGVPLTPKDIRDIITEQRSAATKVLYQLRTLTERKPKAAPVAPQRTVEEWSRESAADLIDDPTKRSDMEFIRKAIDGG